MRDHGVRGRVRPPTPLRRVNRMRHAKQCACLPACPADAATGGGNEKKWLASASIEGTTLEVMPKQRKNN